MVMGGGLKIGKIGKIGNGFAYYGRSGGAMVKWTPRLDSAHQIGLSTSSKGKLPTMQRHNEASLLAIKAGI